MARCLSRCPCPGCGMPHALRLALPLALPRHCCHRCLGPRGAALGSVIAYCNAHCAALHICSAPLPRSSAFPGCHRGGQSLAQPRIRPYYGALPVPPLPQRPHRGIACICRVSCNAFYLEHVGKGLHIERRDLHMDRGLHVQRWEYSILAPKKILGSPIWVQRRIFAGLTPFLCFKPLRTMSTGYLH